MDTPIRSATSVLLQKEEISIEAYEDKAAFEAHGNRPYFQAFTAAVAGYEAQKATWLVRGTLASSSETP